jgi:2-polyprenyl-3-methyl-5-hydroxy-6-metoxy-1,4-benzoquinol methylase
MKQPTANSQFYTSLVKGEVKRNTCGMQKRFSYENIINNPSVKKYLFPFFDSWIKHSDVVLDYGCGSGVLLPIISSFSNEVHGFDVVPSFVDLAKDLLNMEHIKNVSVYNENEFKNKFFENCFDVIIINDVLHHMENPKDAIDNAYKLLKPEGKLIILEQNRLNPAMFILQVCDQNERKWLKMGYFKYYEKICGQKFEVIKKDWSPLVYGPSSRLVLTIAEICERFPFKLLRWGNPRLYLICKKC